MLRRRFDLIDAASADDLIDAASADGFSDAALADDLIDAVWSVRLSADGFLMMLSVRS